MLHRANPARANYQECTLLLLGINRVAEQENLPLQTLQMLDTSVEEQTLSEWNGNGSWIVINSLARNIFDIVTNNAFLSHTPKIAHSTAYQ